MSMQSDSDTPDDGDVTELVSLTSSLQLSSTVTNEEQDDDDQLTTVTKPRKSVDDLLLESYECLQCTRQTRLDMVTLSSWTTFGEKRDVPFDENTQFADEEIVKRLFSTYLQYEELTDRRTKKQIVNPLEAVKRGFLLNRSAIKFASIDSLMDFMFSEPVDKQNRSLIQPNELMYFVDIGGAPGGFVDYLLWRRASWQTKGFGIPIKGTNYWSSKFTVGCQRFNIFKGAKRDGDVTNAENITSIVRYVKQHVSLGVHVVIADSAFDVQNQKYAKETIFKRMHLGEVILALSLLRSNGHFVIKLFDVLLPFTVGLVYLLHKCFAEVSLFKPKASRPSSGERYVICKWKYADTENVRHYLEGVNAKLNSTQNSYLDVTHLVAEEVLLGDKEFFSFICRSNNAIAATQTEAMLEMVQLKSNRAIYAPDPALVEQCLLQWNVVPKTDVAFDCTFGQWAKIVDSPENSLSPSLPLSDSFSLPGDKIANEWHCIRIENTGNEKRTFFSTTNSTEVKMLNPISSEWLAVPDICLEFPTNTFLYGEIVNHHVHHSDTASSYGFHIIDGLVLNGQDIRAQPFTMRLQLCKKFADAINNPSRFIKAQNGVHIRSAAINCKETFLLKDLVPEMDKFRQSWKTTHSGSKVLGQHVPTAVGPKRFYAVNGLLFLRNFPKLNDETNFDETFQCRQLWRWSRSDVLNTVDVEKTPDDGNVYLSHFCDYLNSSVGQSAEPSSWRNKSRQPMPSRYSNNRGGGRGGARGRGTRGFKK